MTTHRKAQGSDLWLMAPCTTPGVSVGASAGTIKRGVSTWDSRGLPG